MNLIEVVCCQGCDFSRQKGSLLTGFPTEFHSNIFIYIYTCLFGKSSLQASLCDQKGDSHIVFFRFGPVLKTSDISFQEESAQHPSEEVQSVQLQLQERLIQPYPSISNPRHSILYIYMFYYIYISEVVFFKVYVWGCSRQKTVLLTGVVTFKYILQKIYLDVCFLM